MTQRQRLGKYEILEVLGRGAMGVVFKGFDPGIDRTVAIKTVRKELIEDDDRAGMALARFRNEARAAGRLSHPGIVAVYDYGESDEVTYIAMEYVQGNSLREYFNLGTRFGEADVVSIMAQLLEALQHAHEAGVWHRDIKPANLIIMANGRLKIADFGIARIEASQLTQTGVVMGSPGYMAPEQYAGGTIDWRADLFAAAVVMHQLLTGERLYTGSAEQVAYKICHVEPPPPSAVDPGKGWERYDLLLQRALAKNPDHRFPSASAFREAILQAYAAPVNAAVSEETILATTTRPAGVFEPSNPSARTGDPASSPGSRSTPTPPPLAPPPVPAPAAQPSPPVPGVVARSSGRRWPLLAGAAAAAVAGAFLGGWWVSRIPASAPSTEEPGSVQAASAATEAASRKQESPAPPAKARPPETAKPMAAVVQAPPKVARASEPLAKRSPKPAVPSPKTSPTAKNPEASKPKESRKPPSPPPAPKPPRKLAAAADRPATPIASRPAASARAATPAAPRVEHGSSASPLGAPPPPPVPTASAAPVGRAPRVEAASIEAVPVETAPAASEPVETAPAASEPAPTASVQPAPEPAKPPPPPPSIWRDQGITMKVAGKIQFNRRLWSTGIQVETVKGIVYLRGTVSSQALSDEAEKIAAGVYGVHGVKNEIKVSP